MAGKVRLSLDATPAFMETVNRLSEELDCSKSGVFRRALNLYIAVKEEMKKGKELVLVDENDKVVAKIINV